MPDPAADAKKPLQDLAHDIFRVHSHPLDALFKPQSVAVIGATDRVGSVGATLLTNLSKNSFGGSLYAVNPKHSKVMGIPSYPTVKDIPGALDLAVIVTPAATVPGLIEECVQKGVKGAIIISAGFKERGPEGVALEQQIAQRVKGTGLRIIGPNCLGVMNPHSGLNATFAGAMAMPGSVAFLSQSGALCTAILDWSFQAQVGFSAFVSIGSMLDVNWGDLVDYLGSDPKTRSIVMYMESVGDARSFLSAAREVALTKPIILIKAGRTEAASKAAASHTGSLTGSDAVLEAAFRRCGVLVVDRIEDLFYMSEVLSKQPRPKGNRLAIITNAGGPGVLATDALVEGGGQLAPLSPATIEKLNAFLPAHWSHGNPIDVLGDAGPDRYDQAVEVSLKDETSDGFLVIVTPQAMTQPAETAEKLKKFIHGDKPILASLMGGVEMGPIRTLLNQAGIPSYSYPDTAVKLFNYLWKYHSNLMSLYETPALAEDDTQNQNARRLVQNLFNRVQAEGRTLLTESESKQVLAAYGIPVTPTQTAETEAQAVKAADEIGYPVVVKLLSKTLTHKTDVGGVKLNLQKAQEVAEAFQQIKDSVTQKAGAQHFQGVTIQPMIKLEGYELILGSSLDPQFGPILLFGMGGQLVEVFKDSALGLPPLTTTLARRLMEQTKIYTALKGIRGRKPVDLDALEKLLVQFSRLVAEQPLIKEMDINPLIASAEALIAVDARVVLHDPKADKSTLPRPAIRPYPTQYVKSVTLKDGTEVTFRPIRPEDENLMEEFHRGLSERSVYLRYFQPLNLTERVAHERLLRICFIDYDREMALVADYQDASGKHELLGVGRLSPGRQPGEREFSLLVSDQWQNRGLGSAFLRELVVIGRAEKLKTIRGHILPENQDMQKICKSLGFTVQFSAETKNIEALLKL
jgi:acetyltransferase